MTDNGAVEPVGRHSQRVKELRRIVRRRPDGVVVVDGLRLALDLVRWEIPLRELFVTAGVAATGEAAALVATAERTFLVDPDVLAAVAPTRSPQGVLVVVDEPRWPAWSGRHGLALWLDGVQDPGNVGAVVRAAAGLGAAAVLLAPGCADPFGPAAVRGAAGACFRMTVERDVSAPRAAARVRESGGETWATGVDGMPLDEWAPRLPMLLMLGTEGRGLSAAAIDEADGTVTIPLARDVESLNLAVAAGVLLARVRRDPGEVEAALRR